jgi:uncharacterized protein
MNFIFDGPIDGPLFVFAHGAGAPADSDFMQTIALGLAKRGIRVARFNFPYMQQRIAKGTKRPPERVPKLIEQLQSLLNSIDKPMIVGGKSMGGRIASLVASDSQHQCNKNIKGIACLGFPFHPTGKPEKLRTDHFKFIQQPILIIQGDRDTMGTKEEVATYDLPANIEWLWLTDGNHDLKPRIRSGHSHQQHLERAIDTLADFIEASAPSND